MRIDILELDDLFRVLNRQHLQKRGIDQAEDCRNSADAERENQDGRQSKPRRPPQLTERIAQVLPNPLENRRTPRLVRLLTN